MVDRRERLLTLFLVGAILVSVLAIVYLSATPELRTDPYTELYIEGSEGNAGDYPRNLTVGEAGALTVGIGNHEHQTMQYTLLMQLDGEEVGTQTVTVGNDETWERERRFTPSSPGRKRLQIDLYRGEELSPDADPYRTVYLWVTVEEG